MNKNYQVILFYKYIDIPDPKKVVADQKALCESLNLKGRIIIAKEGINGTLEGTVKNTEEYIKNSRLHPWGVNVAFKKSVGDGQAFPKLSVKLRDEIVSSYIDNLDPNKATGKYITPKKLHEWINSNREFYIVDMRNDYEQEVGYFKNSLLAPFKNFRDLPKVLPLLNNLKGKTIVTVCTGGVRCEKASGFLINNGFANVYQLYGGIVSYMEKYPNEDFFGVLYVFDGRVTIGFNINSEKHKIVGKCKFCLKPAEKYFDCKDIHCDSKRHFVSCDSCIKLSSGYCFIQ